MRKVIAAMNMTLDGFCDHTAMIADGELHEHFNELLKNTGVELFGRTTYQLMESAWPALVEKPSGDKASDDFAVLIDSLQKIVFSRTLKNVTWKNSAIAKGSLQDEVSKLRSLPGKNIVIGSPSLIAQSLQLNLVDELQLCIHPVVTGKGLTLFKDISDRIDLKLVGSKTFGSGVMVVYYQRTTRRN